MNDISRLQSIITGDTNPPSKIVYYADPAFGKSTLGSMLEKPIMLRTEEGRIKCARLPIRHVYDELLVDIKSLIEDSHEFKTLVVDCFDGVEKLCCELVAKTEGKETVADIEWGKGPPKVAERLRRFFRGLDLLSSTRGMNVVLLSHVHTIKIKSPMSEAYDKFSPCTIKDVAEFLESWADAILFGQFKTVVAVGKTDKRGKGIGDGSRVIYAQNRPSYMAKNRYNLSEKYDVDTPEDVLEIFNTINKGN